MENVAGVMEKVVVDKRSQLWERVLKPTLQTVETFSSRSSEKEKTHVCSDVYISCHPESSWEHLTSLLYEIDELTAVDQARPFLPLRGKLYSRYMSRIAIRQYLTGINPWYIRRRVLYSFCLSVCISITTKSAAYLVFYVEGRCHRVLYGVFKILVFAKNASFKSSGDIRRSPPPSLLPAW